MVSHRVEGRKACALGALSPCDASSQKSALNLNGCYATLRDHKPFDEAARLNKKERRQSFAMPD